MSRTNLIAASIVGSSVIIGSTIIGEYNKASRINDAQAACFQALADKLQENQKIIYDPGGTAIWSSDPSCYIKSL